MLAGRAHQPLIHEKSYPSLRLLADRSQMNSLKLILVLVCFTPVSLQRTDELKQLKDDLLNLLEIREKPKVSRSRSQVPKYVMDMYKIHIHTGAFLEGKRPFPGKTIRTFFRGMYITSLQQTCLSRDSIT